MKIIHKIMHTFLYGQCYCLYKTEPIIYLPLSDDESIRFLRASQYDIDCLSVKLLIIF
jgi:hypothetical protein